MTDVKFDLRKACFDLLYNQITYLSNIVPVYDFKADTEELYPFVLISSQTQTEITDFNCEYYDCTVLFDIVTGHVGKDGSRKQCDLIAKQVLEKLTDMENYSVSLESDTDLLESNNNFSIIRRLLRLRFLTT